MSHRTICQLPNETTALITSSQIITSVSTAVKELVENSLDAGAKNITIKLENYGLDIIEVKDDGIGVGFDNVQKMFLSGYTSKIRKFDDLDHLQSYGFRGEALGALCKVSQITIITKTEADSLAMEYKIDSNGLPISSKPHHVNKGTIISVTNLFSNLPVRKQYLSSKKRMTEELKKVEQAIQSLAVIHPEVRVVLMHNKSIIWQKNAFNQLKQSYTQLIGIKLATKMEYFNDAFDDVVVDLIIPKKNLENVENLFTSMQNVNVYVNRRPVACKEIAKVVTEHVIEHYKHLNLSNKSILSLISINMPPEQIDVNLEPNKTKVLMKNLTSIINFLDKWLANYYGHHTMHRVEPEVPEIEEPEEEIDPQRKKPRLEEDELVTKARTREFKEKNEGWHLEIINVTEKPVPLCSQINIENCTLTSEQEVSDLNRFLTETNSKGLCSVSAFNSEVRLVDRDVVIPVKEKPILPGWPCRGNNSDKSDVSDKENGDKGNDIRIEDWSKGHLRNEEGKSMEGGAVLLRPPSASSPPSQVWRSDVDRFDLSMESISSQMGKKEMSAFTKFARLKRDKIIEEHPKASVSRIADLLTERWKALNEVEKRYYEKLAEAVDEKRKIHKETKKEEKKEVEPKPNNDVKIMFAKMKEKLGKKRPARKQINLEINLEKIIRLRNSTPEIQEDKIELIGQLKPSGNWLYFKKQEIGHVRHKGLQELIIYQKMLSNHSVPKKDVDKSVILTEENLGTEYWKLLTELETEFNPLTLRYVISNDVVSKNGFQVELEKDEDGNVRQGVMTRIASVMPHFGLTELKDALQAYRKNGECGGMSSWRPVAVLNYISNEAIRITQESPRALERHELQELLDTWQLCLTHLPPQCLHCSDIFVPIYQIETNLINKY